MSKPSSTPAAINGKIANPADHHTGSAADPAAPLVSVVIPTYMGARFLRQAIDSVLAQSYANFEVIVVNDASPDDTDAVMAEYSDPRVRYIVHETNRGAGVARDTATKAAHGSLIAFLDHDDFLHPDKLRLHVAHFAANPQLGGSYSGRFELNATTDEIRDIWQTPQPITLADLVLGFPIAPSDLVLRREWALRPDIDIVHEMFHGGEIIRYGRLYLDGCTFAPVPRALSYHRYHAGRVHRQIERFCNDYLLAQNTIFDDERCPPEVRALRSQAHTMSYLVWANYALNQNETELAHKLLRQAAALTPTLVEGPFCQLAQALLAGDLESDYADHEGMLRNAWRQLPAELAFAPAQLEAAIARGYLLRALRCLMWGRDDLGAECFERAMQMHAVADDDLVAWLTHQLLNYEVAFGPGETQRVVNHLAPYLARVGDKRTARQLLARLAANRAFRNYRAQDYRSVPADCVQAIVHDPRLLANRGVLSALVRSLSHFGSRAPAH